MRFVSRVRLTCRIALIGLSVVGGAVRAAVPLVTVYDNTTNATDFAWFNPPSDGGPTGIVADDITPIAGYAGQPVTQFQFGLYNNNTTASVITPTAYFYQNDGASGGPGTLIASHELPPVAIGGLSTTTVNEVNPLGYFNLPTTTFWAGLSFTAISADDANAIGQLVYYPALTGMSADLFF